jgi:hypothetical protein
LFITTRQFASTCFLALLTSFSPKIIIILKFLFLSADPVDLHALSLLTNPLSSFDHSKITATQPAPPYFSAPPKKTSQYFPISLPNFSTSPSSFYFPTPNSNIFILLLSPHPALPSHLSQQVPACFIKKIVCYHSNHLVINSKSSEEYLNHTVIFLFFLLNSNSPVKISQFHLSIAPLNLYNSRCRLFILLKFLSKHSVLPLANLTFLPIL